MKNSEVIAKKPKSQSAARFRLAVIFAGVVVGFALVCLRLVQLQVLGNQALQDLAKRQFMKSAKTAPYRLPIFDRNGEELAASIPSSSAYARPKLMRDKYGVAKSLARILGGHHRMWLSKLRGERPFVWLKRQMDVGTSRRIAALNLEGVFLEQENKRVYPNGSLAAHLLGFTDIDGHGIAGVEMSLNQELIVESDVTEGMKDGHGKPSYIASRSPKQEERSGIFLTIDRRIQHVVEEELEQTLQSTGAKAAMGIVLDPFTGEILALGQTPAYDPNEFSRAPEANLVNRLVSHRFEPGSTIKVLFAAEAIQDGIMNANTPVNCEGGKIKVGDVTVTEAETDHQYGVIPLRRVIRHSSNVGAVKVAQALGAERMISTMNRFGLTSKTNVGLPGENSALPKPPSWFKSVNLASAGFGQGISTTPLQMAASFAPFANGGFWVRPKLLLDETAPKKDERLDIRRVLSLKTVEVMRSMLTEVTEEEGGTGKEARVPGIRVAGKTGTAQKAEPGIGYKAGSYYSSFIGFLPADRPQFLIAVMVDEPKKPYYGSVVAAPTFRRIAERSLQILGKTPRKTIAQNNPNNSETAVTVLPSAPAPTLEGGEDGKWIMPNLAGVSLREAMSLVGPHVSNFTIQGSGYLTGQSPDAGTVITSQTAVRLSFSPAVARSP